MKDGLYKVFFQTPLGIGAGVVFAKDGRMWGGDSSIYYVGTFSEENGELTATVDIDEHTKVPGMASVFGVANATIVLSGTVNGGIITAKGTSPQAPGISFSATLTHISD